MPDDLSMTVASVDEDSEMEGVESDEGSSNAPNRRRGSKKKTGQSLRYAMHMSCALTLWQPLTVLMTTHPAFQQLKCKVLGMTGLIQPLAEKCSHISPLLLHVHVLKLFDI